MSYAIKLWSAILLLPILSLIAGEVVSAQEDTAEKVSDTKFGGLDNLKYFAQKVRKKEPVVIGYLGGSITQGAGASAYGNNYYWKSKCKLEQEIKKRGCKVKTYNAAIGGTGSGYACYRAGAQIFVHKPDLLIVEFAVNDGSDPEAAENMESLVRQALKVNPQMGIVFLYTSTAKFEENFYSKGLLPNAVSLHHKVASHYGLTEVLTGMLVDKKIKESNLTTKELFPDGVHPSDIGHGIYAQALYETLAPLFGLASAAGKAPVMPKKIGKGKLEFARLDPIQPEDGSEGWNSKKNQWNWYGVPVLICNKPQKSLVFKAQGKDIQLVFQGKIKMKWSANGKEYTKQLNGHRNLPMPASWRFPQDANPDGESITVEAIAGDDGKTQGEVWGLFSIQKP